MKKLYLLIIVISSCYYNFGQVKIGDNPNLIDNNSLIELESPNKVLVVTRISSIEMNAIAPLNGSIVYNTDEDCLFQFNNNSWTSLCIDVMENETITTLVDNNDGSYTYTSENGTITVIENAALTDNGDGSFTFNGGGGGAPITIDVPALETLTSIVNNLDGTFSYIDENGNSTVIDISSLETLTTLTLNSDNTNIEYTDEDGLVTQLDLTEIVQNLQTLTSLVDNNDGTFTYTDEGGTATILDISNLETLTNIALNPDNINIDYTDEDGVVTQLNLTNIVQNLESQDISSDGTPGNLTISNGSNITLNVDDADADPTNELITSGTLNGTDLEITDAGGTTVVDLSALNNSGTDDQNLTSATIDASNILTIAIEDGDPVSVDLSAFLDNTDEQNLTGASIDASNILTIEIQNGDSTSVDLSDYLDNTDDQNLSTDGSAGHIAIEDGNNITLNVDDADADPTNEVNTAFEVTGGNLAITDSNGTLNIPLTDLDSEVTQIVTSGHTIATHESTSGTTTDIIETVTSISQNDTSATGEITYTDENGNNSTAQVIGAETDNQIVVGANGGAYLGPTVYTGVFVITSSGNTTVTGLPFKPSQITFVAHANVEDLNINADNGVGNNARGISNSFGTMNGFARLNDDNSITQQVIYVGGHGNSINDISRFSSSSDCIGLRYGDQNGNDLGVINGALTTFTADGFTINATYTNGVITNNSTNPIVRVQPDDVQNEDIVVIYTAYR